tara:strand:+ start:1158 stop:1472 length:315 start_codon:yes stop_codon:yes gene_type:complete
MKKSVIKNFFFHSVALFLIIYFTYHSLFGKRGLVESINFSRDIRKKAILLRTKQALREKIQQKVNLLQDEDLDLDLLDELSRKNFSVLKKAETILVLRKKSYFN